MHIEPQKWSDVDFSTISDIFTRCNRSFLSDGLPKPYTRERVESWFNSTVKHKDGKTGLFRIIFVDGAYAGDVSVECQEDVYARDADIGYVLLDEYKGRGVMTAAVDMICAEAFERLDILRITARVFSANTASCRVLEKNGFEREGCKRRAVCKGENIYDMYIYGRLK